MSLNENSILKPRTDFDDCYVYGDEIGKGRYATVKKCYCKKTDKCYAAKIIKNFRAKHAKLNLNIVENEITALSIARSHPSIINLYEIFHHKGETILILEYATEKDLHIYLDSEGAFEEKKACEIIYQILKAIEFLHSKHVLHLDIKPENVLLMSPLSPKSSPVEQTTTTTATTNQDNNDDNSTLIKVKLCDFSFSQIMKQGKAILGMMGTPAYSAPEILQYEELTKATDMWSLGVLTHVILTEYTPFGNGTEENNQTQTNILSVREKEFECVEDYFDNISSSAKNFIESLLKFRPKQRLTIEQALNHEWFNFLKINNTQPIISNDAENSNNNDSSLLIETTANKIIINNNELTNTTNTNNNNIEVNKLIKDDKNNNIVTSKLVEDDLVEKQQSQEPVVEITKQPTLPPTPPPTSTVVTQKVEVKCEIKIKNSKSSSSSISNESLKSNHHHNVNNNNTNSNTTSKLISNNLRSNKSASLLTTTATATLSNKTGQVKLIKSANKSSSSIIDHHHLHQRFEAAHLTTNNNNENNKLSTSNTASSKVNQLTSKLTTKVAATKAK